MNTKVKRGTSESPLSPNMTATIVNIHGEKVEVEIRATQASFSADEDYGPSRWEVLDWKRRNPFQVVSFGEYGNTLWTGSRESCEAFIAMRQSAEATRAIVAALEAN